MKNMALKRKIAIFLLVVFVQSLVLPVLVRGENPPSPDFSGFESSSTRDMVSPFTGDFTYSLPVMEIPGPEGSGYNITLTYHSGLNPTEDASWVGWGFSLTPGSINRNVRGFPDDYKSEIEKFNKMPKNWTVTAGASIGNFEFFAFDSKLNVSAGLRYNNNKGFGYNVGAGLSFNKGVVSLGYNVADGEGSFSLNINPAGALNTEKFNNKYVQSDARAYKGRASTNLFGSSYGLLSYSSATMPFSVSEYEGRSFNVSFADNINPLPVLASTSLSINGSFSYQENKASSKHIAYGYMYSADAQADETGLMDYSLEKETPFSKRDVFLGIPVNNFDAYSVSGEGLNGSFRMYHKRIGQFKPNKVVSPTYIYNVGAEIHIGMTNGVGGDVGKGKQTLEVNAWGSNLSSFSGLSDNDDEPIFFRFSGDMGGYWKYPTDDEPISAGLAGKGTIGDKEYSLKLDATTVMNNNERSGRSSYIKYNLNKSFSDPAQKVKVQTRYEIPGLDRTIAPDGIGEFSVTNESGMLYEYGLPVYEKNEKNLRFGISGAPENKVKNNYLAFYSDGSTKVGQVLTAPYATSYLLTAIYTPDYTDRTLDGPTDDDFGGFTKFNYKKAYGGNNFFKWRNPYRGLIIDKGSLSDYNDDIGTVSMGEKEVYYVQSIETKTHIAIFSFSQREDGKEPNIDEKEITNESASGTNMPYKLDRIDLYLKTNVEKKGNEWVAKSGATPIKTVRFNYNYELCKGAPGSKSGAGKLTLEKLWFEYNGISSDKVSAYEFKYEYPDAQYPEMYNKLKEGYSYNYEQQNPNYNDFCSDPWGSYQSDGDKRFNEMKNWINQTPKSDFDPAAWHLKVIKLPTGGEIHVQYEQDDYKYVQDKVAHVMARAINNGYGGLLSRTFEIDPKELGITDSEEALKLSELIKNMYENGGSTGDKKMYFKFFYNLFGINEPLLNQCSNDFITGYTTVESVKLNPSTNRIEIEMGLGDKTTPYQVCKDFAITQRAGMLVPGGDCKGGILYSDDAEKIVRQLIGFAGSLAFPYGVCMAMSPDYSYLRIPVLNAKKGGGLRVKRLLMYDNSFGTPSLYGNEYIYKNDDNSSSGVATNEPASNREENVLVDYIKRGGQSLWSKVIAGKDKEQTEGPIGESFLPGSSVGYSKVYTRNIYSGKTGTGFSVKEYYTAKDYPFQYKLGSLETKSDFVFVPLILYNNMVNNVWATQGFSFIRNEMNGQIKRDASYSGILKDNLDKAGAALVTEQQYEYFKPGEDIPVSTSYASSSIPMSLGKEVDLAFAGKMVKDHNDDANVELDFAVGIYFLFVLPLAGAAPSFSHSEMEMYTHASSKVINYPAVVKKVRSFNEGSYHTTENIAFDKYTGKPVTTKSYDEFTGTYLVQNIPGSWEYKNFQPKWLNEGKVFEGPFTYISDGTSAFLNSSTIGCDLKELLIPGDLIELGAGKLYHVVEFDDLNNHFVISKSQESTSIGEPNGNITSITIVKSGRTNRLSENIGSFTLHSADENVKLPLDLNKDRWNDDDPFLKALNDKIKGISDNQGSFTLDGQYQNVNVEAMISDIPEEYATNLTSATISDVKFMYYNSNMLQLKIISFKLLVNGNMITINGGE